MIVIVIFKLEGLVLFDHCIHEIFFEGFIHYLIVENVFAQEHQLLAFYVQVAVVHVSGFVDFGRESGFIFHHPILIELIIILLVF